MKSIPCIHPWIVVGCLALMPMTAFAVEPQEILGLSLGHSAPDPKNPGGLQVALNDQIVREMKGLILIDQPWSHYQIDLGNDRNLSLWFDDQSPDRPIYWISLNDNSVPPDSYEAIEQEVGEIDYKIAGREGAPLGVALVQIDPTLPAARQAAIRTHVDTVIATRPEPSSQEDPFIELPDTVVGWITMLGDEFRGKVVGIYTISNHIDGVQTELIDTEIASEVLGRN